MWHYNDSSIWHRFSRNNVNECCFGDSFRSELSLDIDAIFTFKQTNPFDITPQIEIHIYTYFHLIISSIISWIWFLQKFWTTSILNLSIKKKKNILENTIIADLIFFTIHCKYLCWYFTHWRSSGYFHRLICIEYIIISWYLNIFLFRMYAFWRERKLKWIRQKLLKVIKVTREKKCRQLNQIYMITYVKQKKTQFQQSG